MHAVRSRLAIHGLLLATALTPGVLAEPLPRETDAPAAGSPAGPSADTGTTATPDTSEKKPKVWFRASSLYWDHSATTNTLGIGRDYQSRNPVYEMAIGLRPRVYFFDREHESLSARGEIALVREFTNSDQTSERGEWDVPDAELWLAYVRTLNDTPGARTDLIVRAPQFVLPTSRASSSNGKILGVGAGLGVEQGVPLRGDDERYLRHAALRANAGYRYHLTKTTVPTNDELDRVRLGPDGRSQPSDQLSGSAFPDHQLSASIAVEPEIVPSLSLLAELGIRYAHRRALDDEVEVCGVVLTGCAEVSADEDASRYSVATLFSVELGYELSDELSLAVGYTNLAPQLGADGQRRQPFYSHDARGYLTLTLALDALYLRQSGQRRTESAARGASDAF